VSVGKSAQPMHDLCMATETLSLRLDAYERLRKDRIRPEESLTEVVLRAQWVDLRLTARELRAMYRTDLVDLEPG